jgi:ribosomal protein L7/L12
MEPVRESLLFPTPALLGAGLVLVALVLMVLRRRSLVVHGSLEGQGRPVPELPEASDAAEPPTTFERIEEELQAGRLSNAIKLYREETGSGLKEAKDAVERMHRELTSLPRVPGLSADSVDADRIQQEIAAGRMLNAIKLYREATGAGLREAKEAVEQLQKEQKDSVPAAELADALLEADVKALLAEGRTIEAVKLVRQRLNLSLRHAKTYVDIVQRNIGTGA